MGIRISLQCPLSPRRAYWRHCEGWSTPANETLTVKAGAPREYLTHQVQLQLRHQYHLNGFTGPVDCVLYTFREKGPLGLYRGLSPWLLFAFPRSGDLRASDLSGWDTMYA
jgi:hypothetical protein